VRPGEPAYEEARAGQARRRCAPEAGLRPYLEAPTGSGLDVPVWLRGLEAECSALQLRHTAIATGRKLAQIPRLVVPVEETAATVARLAPSRRVKAARCPAGRCAIVETPAPSDLVTSLERLAASLPGAGHSTSKGTVMRSRFLAAEPVRRRAA